MIFSGNSEQLIIQQCRFEDNFATVNGGAIWAEGPCLIEENVFTGNRTERGDGAAIYIVGHPDGVYRDNILSENIAGDHGGAFFVTNVPPRNVPATDIDIHHNIILRNQSWTVGGPDCSGAGIFLWGEAWIHHNTIVFNEANGANHPLAGGICLVNTPAGTTIEHNLLYRNNEAAIVAFKFTGPLASVLIRRNLIFGNGPNQVVKKYPEGFDLVMAENVFADPMMCMEGGPEVAGASPALNQAFGPIGAIEQPGCGPYFQAVQTEDTTWGRIKARYGP